MKSMVKACLLVTSLISLNSVAVTIDMKLGLWEHNFKMADGSTGSLQNSQKEQMTKAMEQMKQKMDSMPPEQRKMMEDMMAKQGIKVSDNGIEMPSQGLRMTKDGTSVKACVTPEDIDTGKMLKADENCEQNITQVSSHSLKINFVCKGAHPSHGEGEINFQSNTAYAGKVTFVTQMNGQDQTLNAEESGRWLASDCGDIKSPSQRLKEMKALQEKSAGQQ